MTTGFLIHVFFQLHPLLVLICSTRYLSRKLISAFRRKRLRQTDRQTDKWIDKQTEGQRDKERRSCCLHGYSISDLVTLQNRKLVWCK